MSRAALLAAVMVVPSAPSASINFGPVQLGGAARHVLQMSAIRYRFGRRVQRDRHARRVLIVFEPYELNGQAAGTLTLKTSAGRANRTARPRHRHHPRG
jgi:hypothetical protein